MLSLPQFFFTLRRKAQGGKGAPMPRRIVTIGKNDAGQRLDKFLTKTYPNLPQSVLYKCIRTKDVKRNGKRCQRDDRLQEGDELSLYWQEEFFQTAPKEYDFLKAPKALSIVYEDENMMLLDKKPGLIVHPDQNYQLRLPHRPGAALPVRQGGVRPPRGRTPSPRPWSTASTGTPGALCWRRRTPRLCGS